jgi:NhaP-type Na+/H+ or K+/H+ antiporter
VNLARYAEQAPLWRSAILLLATLSIIVVSFATAYYSLRGHSFNEPLTHIDALYMAVGTLSTAGSGSLGAISQAARGFQTIEMAVGMVAVVFTLSILVARFSSVWSEQTDGPRRRPGGRAVRRGNTGRDAE